MKALAGTTIGLMLSVNHVDSCEVGIAWNTVTGDLQLQGPGIHWTNWWTTVSRIDTRPQRLCVSSSGRGYSCKLVRFVPEGYREFVAAEGHRYYWLSNRLSFNSGYSAEYRGMRDILRGYAYGDVPYPFFEVLRDTGR